MDLLFVYALRAWLARQPGTSARSWFGGLSDPVVGPAVRAIHDDPARAWTVAALARLSGLSRAPFARRFRQAVGEPPLAYVARWRMTVAAELLEDGHRIAGVARQVGYDNEFAFAKAFKRVRGIAPGQHRRRHTGQLPRPASGRRTSAREPELRPHVPVRRPPTSSRSSPMALMSCPREARRPAGLLAAAAPRDSLTA